MNGNMKNKITFGMVLGLIIVMLYINVSFFFSGDVEYMKTILVAYIILLLTSLVILNVSFPTIFDNPMDLVYFSIVFFISSILLLTIPTIPASLVGSIASVVKPISSLAFIQSFIAAFIETIVFIYAVYKVIKNPRLRFWASNVMFVFFHLSMIWSRLGDPVFSEFPWYVIVLVSSGVLFTLNSIFQFLYIKGGESKGMEMSTAFHFAWDLKTFGILALLFGGVVI